MKKKWWLIGLATLAVCGGVAVAIPALQPPGPGVTKANFDRIEDGISMDDVERILGEPPSFDIKGVSGPTARVKRIGAWFRDDGAWCHITLVDGHVSDKAWRESNESLADKLRRWLSFPRK